MTTWWAPTGGNDMVIEKCAVRSEDRFSHARVVFIQERLSVHEQGVGANTAAAVRSTEASPTSTTITRTSPHQASWPSLPAGAQPFLIILPADIKRCAFWGEGNKKHACQSSSAPDTGIIRCSWIPQQHLRCKPPFLLIVTLGLSLPSPILSLLNLLPNKGQAFSVIKKSPLASLWLEES